MKKILIICVLIFSAIMIGCTKESKNTNNLTTKSENKNTFCFIKENDKSFSREYFDKMKPDYFKRFYPNAKDDLISKSKYEILSIFNKPTYELSLLDFVNEKSDLANKSPDKTVWIYRLTGEDPTAI